MLVPKLRFKREDGTEYSEWKSIPLGERFTFKNGINASREAFRAEGIHCIGVSDVYKCLPIIAENVIGTVAVSDDEIEKSKVNYGDILFQRSSETKEDIGHASVYFDETSSVYNGFVICAKPDKLFYDPLYLHYSMQHTRVRKQTITLGAGSGQHYNIGQEGLAQINVVFPCLEEQQRISDLLFSVDEVIAQSEAEVQNLEQQKKAAMQKIFSQEVRFKREDGLEYPDWGKKLLGSLCKIKTGKLNANAMVENGKYRFYTCASEFYYIDTYAFDTEALLVSGNGANVGYVHYYKGKFNAYQRTYVLDNFSEYILYVKSYLDFALKDRIDEEKHFGNVPYIVFDTLAKMIVFVPCLEEQQKIADFLSSYDEAINYAKQELEHWKQLKKGLLQQMFV